MTEPRNTGLRKVAALTIHLGPEQSAVLGPAACCAPSRRMRPPVRGKGLRRLQFYPAVAVFRSALISFSTQISAAPCTGSVLPGNVSQPLFMSMSPR